MLFPYNLNYINRLPKMHFRSGCPYAVFAEVYFRYSTLLLSLTIACGCLQALHLDTFCLFLSSTLDF